MANPLGLYAVCFDYNRAWQRQAGSVASEQFLERMGLKEPFV